MAEDKIVHKNIFILLLKINLCAF